jgi:hypothetical protein
MIDYTGGLVKSIILKDGRVLTVFNGVLCCPNPDGGPAIVMVDVLTTDHTGDFLATVLRRWSLNYQVQLLCGLLYWI